MDFNVIHPNLSESQAGGLSCEKKNDDCCKNNNDDYCTIVGTYDSNDKLIELLKKTDSHKFVNKFLDFSDAKEIKFLPTYKRDKKNGTFSLKKKEKKYKFFGEKTVGRLPGYADRIIYRKCGKLEEALVYSPLAVTGNDHMPIMAVFDINFKKKKQNSNVTINNTNGSHLGGSLKGIKSNKKIKRKSVSRTRKYRKKMVSKIRRKKVN